MGSGTVSNQDWAQGYSCVAEKRAIETIESGAPQTAFMQFGDRIRIEMLGRDGHSVFGAIEQRVVSSLPQTDAADAAEPVPAAHDAPPARVESP